MSWTDERVALLTRLWTEGKTAAEIARELGGVTRNAVIGKAHRLKLSNRVSPIQQNTKPPAAARKPKAAPAPANRKMPQSPSADEARQGVPLMSLKASQCRWPLGDPQDADFGFCGERKLSGLPYCAGHAKIAYQAATRNRILKAEEAEAAKVTGEELAAARKAIAK